jgi:hypothetical protein
MDEPRRARDLLAVDTRIVESVQRNEYISAVYVLTIGRECMRGRIDDAEPLTAIGGYYEDRSI